jgi:hypothetical protein
MRVTSWIESTAPSEETQRRGRRRSRDALRAYSIDEIGVERAREQHAVQLRRDAGHLLDVVGQAMEDRRHVHVRDAPEADHETSSTQR